LNNRRRPEWLKVRLAGGRTYSDVRRLVNKEKLHTVCQSARCPNIGDCWSRRTATFMIMGDICTRNCRFCAVQSGHPAGVVDWEEPERLAQAVRQLNLRHAVVTSVTRDDLPDGGAGIFAETIRKIRQYAPGCSVEVLIPDFKGDEDALNKVLEAEPDILNHNLEVVPRLYSGVRSKANFQRSLGILETAKRAGRISKTGIMVGLGESRDEIIDLFARLVQVGLDILTIGQYLQPTPTQLPVEKYYHPDEFRELKETGEAMGIQHVQSGPLVRSSYHADQQMEKLGQPAS